ncbi:SF0329 family protein [Teredinibacter franksiae]|uniref:SF0329 family protein n=1 Tax=Teredinibacter franksiae TaxID=2761453 RepID=UPI001629CA49|nr:hypothetical protein [Teredinibacter franksiae]
MKWTKLKKNVESFFSEKVKGRVELRAASYNGTHDNDGRGYITVDGKEVWNMCTLSYYSKEHEKILKQLDAGAENICDAQIKGIAELDKEGTYSQWGYYNHLQDYCSYSIDLSLVSDVPLIKSLAMLDSRVGKRRLKSLDVSSDHEMVVYFFNLRCQLENIQFST